MEGCFSLFFNFWSLTLKDLVFIGNEVELHHFLDYFLWDHSFSTYAKFFEKLTFITP